MLSIIILSYRNPALLRLCLKSLSKALITTPLTYEVIVVDNATTLETRQVVTDEFKNIFQSIKLVPLKENTGYTRGVNEGVRVAQGDYILMLNQDIVTPEGSIEKLVQYHQQHPEIGLIAPELLNFNGTHQDSYFRFYTPITMFYRRIGFLPFAHRILDNFLMRETDPQKIQKPNWVSGAAFMTSRKALDDVGLMDESLFHYFSDVDWSHRFWDNEYQVVYYPKAQLFHYLGRTSKGRLLIFDMLLNRTTHWHMRDAIVYFWKYGFFSKPKLKLSHATTS
jgi:GT2 family glycosyltransferase